MTRINTVHPKNLKDKHMFAEYRELPRVFNLVRARVDKGQTPKDVKIPDTYRMGSGHVTFFFDKLQYLKNRQDVIISECIKRGFNISHKDTSKLLDGIPKEWCNDWIPDENDINTNMERLIERGAING